MSCEELAAGLGWGWGVIQKYTSKGPKAKSWEEKKQKSRASLEEEKNTVDKDGGAKGLKEQGWNGVPAKHHSVTSKPQEEVGVCLLRKHSS